MGKSIIRIGENKGADQLRKADHRLTFRYTDSTIPLLSNFRPLTIFCDCTARFVPDLVGTQIVGFLTLRLSCISLIHMMYNQKMKFVLD